MVAAAFNRQEALLHVQHHQRLYSTHHALRQTAQLRTTLTTAMFL